VIGRLRPGVSLAQARAGMALLTDAFRSEFKGSISKDGTLDLDPYRAQIGGDLRTPMGVLLGAIGFVLLIACANVASLMLARSATRQHELAVRTALGATRRDLVRQLLAESVMLGLVGGAFGLVVAGQGVSLLLALARSGLPATADIRLDGVVLAFTAALSLLTGVGFGILPAWQATRAGPDEVLKERAARIAGTARVSRLRHALVVGEIALSLVLLLGAGLLIQTFARLLRTDPGFDARHLVTAEIWLTGTRYESTPAISGFYGEITSRLSALPGVDAAAVIEAGLPLEGGGNTPALVDGSVWSVDYRSVTPGFFRTLGTPVLEGREFSGSDRTGGVPVIIVNQAFVRRYLPNGASLGRTIVLRGYDDQLRQVIGVVGDARSFVGDPAPPTVFIPSAQAPAGLTRLFGSWFPIHVVIRTRGDPSAVAAQLAGVVRSVDPLVPLGRVRAMDEVLWSSLAIVLAALGIYGVISHLVAQRTHELGVRVALGAQSRDLLQMVVGRGAVLTGLGILVGLVGALAVTRLIAGFLYGVRPTDVPTILGVTTLLAGVALIATWLPARRAARVDPMVALRYE
jgi:predicted permease